MTPRTLEQVDDRVESTLEVLLRLRRTPYEDQRYPEAPVVGCPAKTPTLLGTQGGPRPGPRPLFSTVDPSTGTVPYDVSLCFPVKGGEGSVGARHVLSHGAVVRYEL